MCLERRLLRFQTCSKEQDAVFQIFLFFTMEQMALCYIVKFRKEMLSNSYAACHEVEEGMQLLTKDF